MLRCTARTTVKIGFKRKKGININASLDKHLKAFATRKLGEAFPYLILDASYEKIRIDGVVRSQAVLIAIGIDMEGKRHVLGVELSNRESASSWKAFLEGLRERLGFMVLILS